MLASVGVKAWSGKEDTTLLSMADCRVKQVIVSTATRYGIKPRIQGCPMGERTHRGQPRNKQRFSVLQQSRRMRFKKINMDIEVGVL